MTDNILEVTNLRTYFHSQGEVAKAVDGISFVIRKNKVFGLVGGSGSGKTITALSILRLILPPGRIEGGDVKFKGTDLMSMDEKELRGIRGSAISIVFQEPGSALNPVFTIGNQLTEGARCHKDMDKDTAEHMAMESLKSVSIKNPGKVFSDYPHQLSGGTKQRIMIAMAIINSPELLILDEPTTALDVTIQAEILELLEEIINRKRMSILFISHDLGIIKRMCDDVAVMNRGKIVDRGSCRDVLHDPKNEYTKSLLKSSRALS